MFLTFWELLNLGGVHCVPGRGGGAPFSKPGASAQGTQKPAPSLPVPQKQIKTPPLGLRVGQERGIKGLKGQSATDVAVWAQGQEGGSEQGLLQSWACPLGYDPSKSHQHEWGYKKGEIKSTKCYCQTPSTPRHSGKHQLFYLQWQQTEGTKQGLLLLYK